MGAPILPAFAVDQFAAAQAPSDPITCELIRILWWDGWRYSEGGSSQKRAPRLSCHAHCGRALRNFLEGLGPGPRRQGPPASGSCTRGLCCCATAGRKGRDVRPWPDQVAEALGVSARTIEHLKRRFVEQGLEFALERKRRVTTAAAESDLRRRVRGSPGRLGLRPRPRQDGSAGPIIAPAGGESSGTGLGRSGCR